MKTMNTGGSTDSSRLLAVERSVSDLRVDLHIYIVPSELWQEHLRSAVNQVISDTVSVGFIRVLPDTSVIELRKELESQIGYDLLPENYVFLRCVGRCFTRLRPKQERTMKVKHFIPPQTYAPELFILESSVDDFRGVSSTGSNSTTSLNRNVDSVSLTSPDDGALSTRKRVPPIVGNSRSTQTGNEGWTVSNGQTSGQRGSSTHRGVHELFGNSPDRVSSYDTDRHKPVGTTGQHKVRAMIPVDSSAQWPLTADDEVGETTDHLNDKSAQTDFDDGIDGLPTIDESRSLPMLIEIAEDDEAAATEPTEYPPLSATPTEMMMQSAVNGVDFRRNGKLDSEERRLLEKLLRQQEEEKKRNQQQEEEQRLREMQELKLKQEEEERIRLEAERKRQAEEQNRLNEQKRLENEQRIKEEQAKAEALRLEEQRKKDREQQELDNKMKQIDERRRVEDSKRIQMEEQRKKQEEEHRKIQEEERRRQQLEIEERRKAEKENLLKQLDETRAKREHNEQAKEELVAQAKQLQNKARGNRAAGRDVWKKKYFEEKRKTTPLEEDARRLRTELDALHKKILSQMYNDRRKETASRSGTNSSAAFGEPSEKHNQKIQAVKYQHEIEDVQRRIAEVNMKLTAEMKLRNQVEQELRSLKAELNQRRSQMQANRVSGPNSVRATNTDAPVHWTFTKQRQQQPAVTQQ